MCIGLKIKRPEAAICDPSRLIIEEISCSFISARSFMNAARYKLLKEDNAHGGFMK